MVSRYAVTITVFVEACGADEAALIVERALAASSTAGSYPLRHLRWRAAAPVVRRVGRSASSTTKTSSPAVASVGFAPTGSSSSTPSPTRSTTMVRARVCGAATARRNGPSQSRGWTSNERYEALLLVPRAAACVPEDAGYVERINHYIHDACRKDRHEHNRRMEELRSGMADGSIDSIPDGVRGFVLERMTSGGFSRRCPCIPLSLPPNGMARRIPPTF
ncbi:MAG: hypothetical protein M3O70_27140 [Actinomycetota bacterium]|nr:hypothetical protein [Actinomycetota bacterium]